jgi:hypothetical protein
MAQGKGENNELIDGIPYLEKGREERLGTSI